MKKLIIFLVFSFSYCVSFAQFDTSRTGTPYDLKGVWVVVPADTFNAKGYQNDTIRGLIRGGLYLIRQMTNDGEWPIEYLIGDDPTNPANASRLQRGLDKDYVKSVIVTSDTVKNFYLTAGVNFHGKVIKFYQHNTLTSSSSISIDSAVIDANYYSKITDTTVTFTNVKTSGRYFSACWYGAIGNASTNSTGALRKAASVQNVYFYLPYSLFHYNATDSIVHHPTQSTQYDGSVSSSVSDRPAIIVGPSSDVPADAFATIAKTHVIRLDRTTQSNWGDTLCVGVLLRNLRSCNVTIMRSSGFQTGVKCIGINGGFAHNNVTLGFITNNQYQVYLTRSGFGWCNENNFYGGELRVDSGVNPTLPRYGIKIGDASEYQHNNNVFYKPSTELNNITLARPVWIKSGSFNTINELRDEGNDDTSAVISASSVYNNNKGNYISTGYGGGIIADSSGTRDNQFIPVATRNISRTNGYSISQINNITDYVSMYNTDGTINIRDAFVSSSSSGFPLTNTDSISIVGMDYIEMSNRRAVGVQIDTRNQKIFVIKRNVVRGFGGRVYIGQYDSTGTTIGNSLMPQASYSTAYTSGYNGSWGTEADTEDDIILTVATNVKFIRVYFAGGTDVLKLRGYSINCLDDLSGQKFTTLSVENYPFNIAIAPPNSGSYKRGRIILNAAVTKGNIFGWVCDTTGTFGTLASTTGSITNGTNKLIVGFGQGVNISAGVYLNINSTARRVMKVISDTAWLETNATATLSSASINYFTPTWTSIGLAGMDYTGSGSPEGVTFAPKGALYRRSASGQPAIYIKTTDISLNTGWQTMSSAVSSSIDVGNF